MTIDILAVLLISGYAFIIHSPYQKYKLESTSGWVTYLYALYRGVFFGVGALVVIALLFYCFPTLPKRILLYIWDGLTLVLGLSTGLAIKLNRKMNQEAIKKIIKDSSLRQIIYQSIQGELLQITLSTGKVYIGWVFKITPEFLTADMEYIKLTPLFSGHRKNDSLTIILDNQYMKFYGAIEEKKTKDRAENLSRFSILIPMKDVVHIGLFDIKAYQTINKNSRKPISDGGTTSTPH